MALRYFTCSPLIYIYYTHNGLLPLAFHRSYSHSILLHQVLYDMDGAALTTVMHRCAASDG